jgi:hypothetical protein
MQNYYFDHTHPLRPYTFAGDANPGSLPPDNALRIAPPAHGENQWAAESNGTWILIDDYRGREGFLNGKPHTITDFGPLPERWCADPPPPTPEETAEARRAEIMAELDDIDRHTIRPLRAMAKGTATEEDAERLAALESRAGELRAELAE